MADKSQAFHSVLKARKPLFNLESQNIDLNEKFSKYS